MPTITIRLREDEKADLEALALAAGQNVSDYVRETLALRRSVVDNVLDGLNVRVEELWTRVQRLEQVANLD
jgi:hypothetical protein